MEKVAIFYFSGTGNTEFISKLIRDNMIKYKTDLYRVEDILNNDKEVDINSYDIISIGFPSYGFNPPKIVIDFSKKLSQVDHKKVFLFLTCAGPCYLNDVAFFGIKNILRRKGYAIIYEKTICMPANILLKYDDEIVKRIYDAAIKRVELMTKDISNNIMKVRNDRFFPYLFQWLLFFVERIAIQTVPLDFTVEKQCIKCMKCIRICPRKNIIIKGRIKHGLKCEACYRCVYSCPQKAIKGRLYNIAILKEGYNIEKIFGKSKDVEIKTQLKGVYKTMESYFNSQS
jgi:ferredoxin